MEGAKMTVEQGGGKPPLKRCELCNGTGEEDDNGPRPCSACVGNGYIDPDWYVPDLKLNA